MRDNIFLYQSGSIRFIIITIITHCTECLTITMQKKNRIFYKIFMISDTANINVMYVSSVI